MSQLTIFGIPGIALFSLVVAGFILRTLYRTWLGRQCWNCGARKVRKSETLAPLDPLARLFLLVPNRCSGCLTRFYRFQIGRSEELTQRVGQR